MVSSSTTAPFPTYAPGYSVTRSPMTAPSSMTAKGPTWTSFPSTAVGWTLACAETPAARRTGGWNCSTARAKARYGSGVSRNAHPAPAIGCLAMIADAFVSRALWAYFGFDRKVTCPGPASSTAAIPLASTSGPWRTAPIFPARSERRSLFPTAPSLFPGRRLFLRRRLVVRVHQVQDPLGDVHRLVVMDHPRRFFEDEVELFGLHDDVHLRLDRLEHFAGELALPGLHLPLPFLGHLAQFVELRLEGVLFLLELLLADHHLLLVDLFLDLARLFLLRVDRFLQLLVPGFHFFLCRLTRRGVVEDLVDVDDGHPKPFREGGPREYHCNRRRYQNNSRFPHRPAPFPCP